MNKVRNVARFVFRNHPDLSRRATSAYQRRRRNAANRARQEADEPTLSETPVIAEQPAPAEQTAPAKSAEVG